jgi:ankyrin repeat protein
LTALMWASLGGHPEVCSLLIEKGAALDVKDKVSMAGMCACMYAMGSKHRGVTWEPACDGDGDGWSVCPGWVG